MTTRESVIREFLKDPLLVEKRYLRAGESERIDIYNPSINKMVELIKVIINAKFNHGNDNKTTREVNLLLNSKE